MKGILDYTEDPIVSTDIVGDPHSSIVDARLDDGDRRRPHGQGDQLVRQRVGLLEPLRRAGRQGPLGAGAASAGRERDGVLQGKRPRRRGQGPPGPGPGRLQRPARRTARSPTTRGSGRRCRRSNCCASAARRWSSSPTSAGPGGKVDPALSMAPVGERLAELLGVEVHAGAGGGRRRGRDRWPAALGPGEVLLLENTRFEPGETKNDPKLASALAALADLYVNDAFGAAHRAHASTEGVAHHLPGYAGLLLEREVTELSRVVEVAGAAAGRRPRRRQGLRQGRRDRPLPRGRRPDPDRRRDVLQLLPRAGDRRPATRWSRRRASRLAARGAGARPRRPTAS